MRATISEHHNDYFFTPLGVYLLLSLSAARSRLMQQRHYPKAGTQSFGKQFSYYFGRKLNKTLCVAIFVDVNAHREALQIKSMIF